MKKIQISKGQFFVVVFSYVLANDLIRGFYAESLKNNLWVPIIFGVVASIIIFFAYSFILKNNNYKSFTESIENILGMFLSRIIFIMYSSYFIFISFFNLRDITEQINKLLLPEFHIYILGALIIVVIYYILAHGIEVFSRLTTILFSITIFIFISFSIVILSTNELVFVYLFPILENGFKPIVVPAFQMGYSIPFGELFALLLIFQYVRDKKKGLKFGIYAIIASGFILLLITLYNIIVVGPHAMILELCPGLRISKRLEIKQLLQRFDLLVLNVMMSLMFVKLIVLLFASKQLINRVVKLKRENIITIIICISLIIALKYFGQNYTALLNFRKAIVIPYINLVFELIIPFILIIISFFRNIKLTVKPEGVSLET